MLAQCMEEGAAVLGDDSLLGYFFFQVHSCVHMHKGLFNCCLVPNYS